MDIYFFFEDFFFEDPFFFAAPFFRGTFAPDFRASDSPIAIACLRLLTRFPPLPLFKVPRLRSCIARLTFFAAFLPYLAIKFPLHCRLQNDFHFLCSLCLFVAILCPCSCFCY